MHVVVDRTTLFVACISSLKSRGVIYSYSITFVHVSSVIEMNEWSSLGP